MQQKKFHESGNLDKYIETLFQCKILAEKDVQILCERVKSIF